MLASLVALTFAPAPALTLQVMRQLGPIDALRCLHQSTYTYAPHSFNLDGSLLHERPEDMLNDGDLQRVEVNLRTGEAVVWSKRVVFVLQPTELTSVTDDEGRLVCVRQLAGWQIVGTHALG